MQRDYELSAFNRRQVYSKSVHRPPLKPHPSKVRWTRADALWVRVSTHAVTQSSSRDYGAMRPP